MNRKKYVLYGHDGSANHGCEALARTTAELLDYKNNPIALISSKPDEDITYKVSNLCTVYGKGIKRDTLNKNLDYFRAYYSLKVKHVYFPMDALFEAQALGLNRKDVALAIGGDSYCYTNKMREMLYHQHKVFKVMKMKTVLWGCSIEEDLLDNEKLLEDLKSFDLITARESLSFEALKRINPNTLLVADSAFVLKAKCLPMPEGFEEAEIVGINTSPLIERRETSPGIARKNVEKLIECILEETSFKVLLIPHVVWSTNDDRAVLRELFEKYKNSGRVAMIEDHNCEELKGYISRCRFMIAARTHASIAAYSSCVPTLVLGYSTKSKGIAKDIFGDYKNYVVAVQDLKEATDLTEKWKWLIKNEDKCREKLQSFIPEYKQRVFEGVNVLKKL